MKTTLKSIFKEVAALIRSESGEFQPYDRKVELIHGEQTRPNDKPAPGEKTDIYLQGTYLSRRD